MGDKDKMVPFSLRMKNRASPAQIVKLALATGFLACSSSLKKARDFFFISSALARRLMYFSPR